VAGSRRLSERISEGDGIAIIVRVSDADEARMAEQVGAKALAIDRAVDGIRRATTLPVLWTGSGPSVDADARTIRPDDDLDHAQLETVVDVRDDEELELALDQLDPEMFLLSPRPGSDGEDPLETVLELLPDVPAGKLAIADVEVASRSDVLALERAGIDAVLVQPDAPVAELCGT
jgi:indole-3-glycerol phosphate synthase